MKTLVFNHTAWVPNFHGYQIFMTQEIPVKCRNQGKEHILLYSSNQVTTLRRVQIDTPTARPPPVESEILQAQKRVFINALCSKKIKLECGNENNEKIVKHKTMIATITTAHILITGPPGLIKFNN